MNQQELLLKYLEKIVNIPSFTNDKKAVNKVNDILSKILTNLGLKVFRYPHAQAGDLLVAQTIMRAGHKIALLGHTDIVALPHFTFFQNKQNKCFGNGIADMKAGLVVMLGVLQKLKTTNQLANITCVFSPDEEIGSVAHKARLHHLYQKQDFALVFEPGLEIQLGDWPKKIWLVNQRNGMSLSEIEIFSDGGHAANKITNRNSAIEEMADKIIHLHKLTQAKNGTLLNVGLISGGQVANVIAPYCRASLDLRVSSLAQYNILHKKIQQIISANRLQVKSQIVEKMFIPPLELNRKSERLFVFAQEYAKKMGVLLLNPRRNGGSDANQAGFLGLGILDALGAVGANLHTDKEWIYTRSIFDSVDFTTNIIDSLQR